MQLARLLTRKSEQLAENERNLLAKEAELQHQQNRAWELESKLLHLSEDRDRQVKEALAEGTMVR